MSEEYIQPESRPYLPPSEVLDSFEALGELPKQVTLGTDGFLHDEDANYLVYRRQRSIDTPFNTKPGKKVKPGLYGNTVGFANTEAALKGASGHIDSHQFAYDVLYRIPAELDVVDLRQRLRLQNVGLRAVSTSVELIGGIPPVTRRVFEKAFQQHDGLLVNRPLSQKVMSPFAYKRFETDQGRISVPPGWMMLHPSQEITPIAYRNRKEKK